MTYLLLAIIGVVVAVSFLFWVAKREAVKHGTTTGEEFVGICKSAIETASRKESRKQKVLAMFVEKSASAQDSGEIREFSNAEIRKALGVSSRTAVRYLDELERDGKIEQVGKVGHAVTYRLKLK